MDLWWSLQPIVWLIHLAAGMLAGVCGAKRGWSLGKTMLLFTPASLALTALNYLMLWLLQS